MTLGTQETAPIAPAPRRLTPDQLDALRAFRHVEGRNWKRALLKSWETVNYPMLPLADMEPLLQNLRNTHGPNWLKRFELKPVRDCGIIK